MVRLVSWQQNTNRQRNTEKLSKEQTCLADCVTSGLPAAKERGGTWWTSPCTAWAGGTGGRAGASCRHWRSGSTWWPASASGPAEHCHRGGLYHAGARGSSLENKINKINNNNVLVLVKQKIFKCATSRDNLRWTRREDRPRYSLEEAELKMPGEPGMAGTGGCIPDRPG